MKQTGQRCTATSRVYIEEAVYEKVVEQFIEEAKKLKLVPRWGLCHLKDNMMQYYPPSRKQKLREQS